MSGLTSGSDHARTEAAGFAGQLDKPFDEQHLVVAIETAIARSVSTTSPAPRVS